MENSRYNQTDFTVEQPDNYYYACEFNACVFPQVGLSGIHFEQCIFNGCDFSMVRFAGCRLTDCTFKGCRLQGASFLSCDGYPSFRFEDCQLRFANFSELSLKNQSFVDCDFSEASFEYAKLPSSHFVRCDLTGALFHQTDLRKADFSTSWNISLIPEQNRLGDTVFSRSQLEGLVAHLKIKVVE